MAEYRDGHVLSKDQIKDLRKQGHKLDADKTYAIRFLFNDKWNKATQPGPFRIKTEILDKLANDAIGMPWMVLEYGTAEHPDVSKEKDPAKKLYDIMTKYAIGQIQSTIRYPSNNVFGIIEVWPEFEGAVQNNLIPPLVSPLLNVIKEDADGISEAQFLNLQSVPKSGYSAQLTQITSMCKGGIKKCMEELALVGAAGNLNASRKDPESFSIILDKIGKTMASTENEVTLESVAKKVEDQGKAITQLSDNVTQIGTDVATIKTTLEGKAGNNPNPAPNPKGAAGDNNPNPKAVAKQITIPPELKDNEFVKTLLEKTETQGDLLKKIEDEREAEKKKAAELKRKTAAESIVSILIKHKKIEEKEKDKEIKKYLELKNEDGSFQDLDGIEATLKSVLGAEAPKEEETPAIKGAYGSYSIPDLAGDKTGQHRTNSEILGVN